MSKERWDSLHKESTIHLPHNYVVNWANGAIAPGDTVLDLGCGVGRHSAFLVAFGCKTYACDYSEYAISLVSSCSEIAAAVCEADALPYEDNKFDAVICYGVLYYLPKPRVTEALKEIHRVLKPGGKLFLVMRSEYDGRAVGRIPPAEQGMDIVFYSQGQLYAEIAYEADFDIERFDRSRVLNTLTEDDDWVVYAIKPKYTD